MEKIIFEKEFKKLPYRVTLQKKYSPNEEIVEFSKSDIDDGIVLCSERAAIIDANKWRVLWKFEPLAPNILDKINSIELYEFFDALKDSDVSNISKMDCPKEPIIVFYYKK